MADNYNQNQGQGNDPFSHPVRRNNWWLYIFGGMVLGGLIAWFFIDWSYKNRHNNPQDELPTEKQIERVTHEPAVEPVDTIVPEKEIDLPPVTVEAPEVPR